MNKVERDKKFVKEALPKISKWRSKPSSLKSFFQISQHTYEKFRNISEDDLKFKSNIPVTLKECLLQLGECEINSSLTLFVPLSHEKYSDCYVFGRYKGFGKIGRLLYKSGCNENVYIESDHNNEIEMISDDIKLLLALETIR